MNIFCDLHAGQEIAYTRPFLTFLYGFIMLLLISTTIVYNFAHLFLMSYVSYTSGLSLYLSFLYSLSIEEPSHWTFSPFCPASSLPPSLTSSLSFSFDHTGV